MSRKPPEWDRVFKRVRSREWSKIAGDWLKFIPVGLTNIHEAPDDEASDDDDMSRWIESYPTDQAEARTSDEFSIYRSRAFYESCFLLTKSIYILEGVVDLIIAGCPSWTQSDAYHAAFFSCRAVLGLLGIQIVEAEGKSFVVDLWPEGHEKGRKKQTARSETLAVMCRAPQHRHRWGLFQRTLRVSKVERVEGWSIETVALLIGLKEKDFADQRNQLHYHTDYWPLPDIANRLPIDNSVSAMLLRKSEADPSAPGFSLWLAVAILRLGVSLGRDIGKFGGVLQTVFGGLTERLARIEWIIDEQ